MGCAKITLLREEMNRLESKRLHVLRCTDDDNNTISPDGMSLQIGHFDLERRVFVKSVGIGLPSSV